MSSRTSRYSFDPHSLMFRYSFLRLLHVDICDDACIDFYVPWNLHQSQFESTLPILQFFVWRQRWNTCFKIGSSSSFNITVSNRRYIITYKSKKLNTKKKWTKRWLIQRKRFSNFALLKELKRNESCDCRNDQIYNISIFPFPFLCITICNWVF